MKENVGKEDRLIRSISGPVLLAVGYLALGGNKGKTGGLISMMTGVLLVESAITRVCPVNEFFGIDTRKKKRSPARKINEKIRKALV